MLKSTLISATLLSFGLAAGAMAADAPKTDAATAAPAAAATDAPAPKIPVHNSFGGEGTEYQQHLLPTISLVTGPWTLYNPAFGMEAIDGTSPS